MNKLWRTKVALAAPADLFAAPRMPDDETLFERSTGTKQITELNALFLRERVSKRRRGALWG